MAKLATKIIDYQYKLIDTICFINKFSYNLTILAYNIFIL